MIVTVILAKGTLALSKKKVIVKRMNAIQNFGAMDVLCTDKTGTITQGKVILEKHADITGKESERVLDYAYLNSANQTGLRNLMDMAILAHGEVDRRLDARKNYSKLGEIPADFNRKRMSVVLQESGSGGGRRILICNGAVEEVLALSKSYEDPQGHVGVMSKVRNDALLALAGALNAVGFRVLALASRRLPPAEDARYGVVDERDLTLMGFLAFLDPPKDSAKEAIFALRGHSVSVKILTGDNGIVTQKICQQVGLDATQALLGQDIDAMPDAKLASAVETANVFAKLSPLHKGRIIRALQQKGHVVGFLGDGINDAPALRTADVGISVNTAVDIIAKESSDIILFEQNLSVLGEGVVEGRRVFGNIVKYLKMATSSNFGNMLSVVGASIFLPFLPMLPVQILTNNILCEVSQVPIPTDRVDEEFVARPRKWEIGAITKFVLFVGPVSSLFDYATYFIMLFVFNAWANPALFHTGWFVESLIPQTLIVHIIRTNRIPFLQSRASWWMMATTALIVSIGIYILFSFLTGSLGFVALPPLYWVLLAAMMVCYFSLAHLVKSWVVARFEADSTPS